MARRLRPVVNLVRTWFGTFRMAILAEQSLRKENNVDTGAFLGLLPDFRFAHYPFSSMTLLSCFHALFLSSSVYPLPFPSTAYDSFGVFSVDA